MYVYLCQMSWYVLLYFVVFDFVSIWYLFSLILTIYSMYLCILYMSPLYINMFLYFSISLFYLSYFTWLYCVCPLFLKTVFFLSWITCNVMHVYFVFQTMYLTPLTDRNLGQKKITDSAYRDIDMKAKGCHIYLTKR